MANSAPHEAESHVIVVGNEKGGCGKTTIAMHIAIGLMHEGYDVVTIDIDARQRSLTRCIENRRAYILEHHLHVPFPRHFIVNRSQLETVTAQEEDERTRFETCLARARGAHFIIVDAPGSDGYLSRLAHSYADTIITPINDSFIDLDLLATIQRDTLRVERPGVYSEMVWDAKKQRATRDGRSIDWVVLRNRLTNLDAHNKRSMSTALKNFSARLGCRLAQGLSERVIFRELFLKGLTLLDVLGIERQIDVKVSMGHVAARQELRDFMEFLALPKHIHVLKNDLVIESSSTRIETSVPVPVAPQNQVAEPDPAFVADRTPKKDAEISPIANTMQPPPDSFESSTVKTKPEIPANNFAAEIPAKPEKPEIKPVVIVDAAEKIPEQKTANAETSSISAAEIFQPASIQADESKITPETVLIVDPQDFAVSFVEAETQEPIAALDFPASPAETINNTASEIKTNPTIIAAEISAPEINSNLPNAAVEAPPADVVAAVSALRGLQGETFSGSDSADKISASIPPATMIDESQPSNYFTAPTAPAPVEKLPLIDAASGLTVEEAARWQVPPQQTLTTPFWIDPSGKIPPDNKE